MFIVLHKQNGWCWVKSDTENEKPEKKMKNFSYFELKMKIGMEGGVKMLSLTFSTTGNQKVEKRCIAGVYMQHRRLFLCTVLAFEKQAAPRKYFLRT